MAINQVICEQDIRGHFISILYNGCVRKFFEPGDDTLLKWFDRCPDDLIGVQGMYRKYL